MKMSFDIIASVMHLVCCSLGGEVINGSPHSVCSRQALLLPLPRRAPRTSLTPSQEEAKWMAAPCQRERKQEGRGRRVREGGATKEEQVRRQIEGLITKINKEMHKNQQRDEVESKKRNTERKREESQSRSFPPSTHQRAWLLRCLVGVKSRRTDCSQ